MSRSSTRTLTLHRPASSSSGRPAVSDPDYILFLRNCSRHQITVEGLAVDYREACHLQLSHIRDLVAERLFSSDELHGYLRVVRIQSEKLPPQRRDLERDDFIQQSLDEIQKRLPTARGEYAELNWDGFCFQCCLDAARALYGDEQHKLEGVYAPSSIDQAEEGVPSPLALLTAAPSSQLPAVEALIEHVVASIPDPRLRLVAGDQFGPDPSYVSGAKRSEFEGKPPLLDQLGLPQTPTNRDRVHTLINRAKNLLEAEIIRAVEKEELDLDLKEVRAWMKRKRAS